MNTKESLFLAKNPDFERLPAFSFGKFVESPEFLGIGEDVYKRIKEEGNKIWGGITKEQYTEGICLWGIGSGKSFLASVLGLAFVHYLLCMKNPHKHYGLASDKPLAVVNMGTTATQAKNVIFAGIRKLVEESNFFQQFKPEILQTEIRFKEKNIVIYCGNSQETMPIGMNVIFGVLDEAAWYLDNDNKSVAKDIYATLKNRIISRFGNRGFMFVISAPRYADDFISRKFIEAQDMEFIYATSFKTWEVKDRNKMSEETFEFKVSDEETWTVPLDFDKVARLNPEKFMRDFGAKPSLVLEAFDKDFEIIDRNINEERESPIEEGTTIRDWKHGRGFKEWFKGDDRDRHIHIDLALNKDACGFTMACLGEDVSTNEGELPMIEIDLMLKVEAPPEGEINFEEIRQVIYRLQERGFDITKVTYDGWQSIDSIQILKSKGMTAETLSVDRTIEPYDTLKSLLHTNRLDYYYFEIFNREYKRLELIKGKKVDHPQNGSKDVSDSVAGVVAGLVNKEEQHGFLEYMKEVQGQTIKQEPMSIEEFYRQQKDL